MPVVGTRSVLSGMRVKEAMRRQIVSVPTDVPVGSAIGRMIKYKSDVILVTDAAGLALGVVSKTDLAGAFYAGLPVDTPVDALMVAPLLFCYHDDPLEDALQTMVDGQVHQLYVQGADAGRFEGMLTYGDILGLVYRYCRKCRKGRFSPADEKNTEFTQAEILVAEVMTRDVVGCTVDDDLAHVIEVLTSHRMRAVLVTGHDGAPAGVISKTDLLMAWHRGVDIARPAGEVMNSPIRKVSRQATLTEAMMRMLLEDLGRLFVIEPDAGDIVGVISLTDAANHRSGTCRACVSSRMLA